MGPFYAKVHRKVERRGEHGKAKGKHDVLKMYVALFTCSSVRAVHL